MSGWINFIRTLSNEVNWDGSNESQIDAISDALIPMRENAGEIVERAVSIIRHDVLFDEYLPHFEFPRPVMDKFVLYMDPGDRFRVRLHKFKSRLDNRGAQPRIHDHRWPYVSLILTGSCREDLFHIRELNETDRTAWLSLAKTRVFIPGDINSGMPKAPHLTVNEDDETPCYTLFIRGKSEVPYSRIFDPSNNTFICSWGLRRELDEEMSSFARQISKTSTTRSKKNVA